MPGLVSCNTQQNLMQVYAYVKDLLLDLEAEEQTSDHIKNQLISIFHNNHPGFCACIIQVLKPSERKQLIEVLDTHLNPEILSYLDETIQKEVCSTIANHKLADMLSRLNETDTSEILENLSAEQLKKLLPSFNYFFRKSIEKVLNFPEDSAGRIMDYKVISIPEEWTIQQIKNFLKTVKSLPKNLNTIFFVDKKGAPTGQIALAEIIRLNPNSNLSNKVSKIDVIFNFLSPIKEIVYAFRQYDLYTAPVVDENNSLIGVINVSTVLNLAQEEAEEDFLFAAGIESSDFHENLMTTSWNRIQWLGVSATIAFFISILMDSYIDSSLLATVTIVTSICGASGVQVVTIIINALNNRELFEMNIKSTMFKEIAVAFINALGFCLVISILLYITAYPYTTIIIFDLALIFSLMCSSLVGILLPFILHKLNIDPALGSGAMLTAITDSMSVLTFILISKIFLKKFA